MNDHIFRQYDIRGVVGSDLNPEILHRIGFAFAGLLPEGKRVAVGRDCRLSSTSLADALCDGLVAGGASTVELGMVPTPVLYYAEHALEVDAAIQLTGSHNPPDYNGLKFSMGRKPFFGEQIQALRRSAQRADIGAGTGTRSTYEDIVDEYVRWIEANTALGTRRLKIVLDAGNGAGGPAALRLFEAVGLDVVPLYCEPDGNFPNHHPDPTVAHNLEALIEAVKRDSADFGVALDGDADRIGVVDEGGEIIWGDRLMIVLSRALLREAPGATILGEVKCSQTLYDDIALHGGVPVMWKVGHSLIKSKMRELGALLAGEMSGHIFFAHRYFGYDDALYTAVRLAEVLSASEGPLSSLLADVPQTFATPELRIDMGNDAAKFAVAERLVGSFELGEEGVVDLVTLDGVRVVFEDGWGLIRASNTQPVLVMRAEATSEARRDEIEALLRARVKDALGRL